MANSNIEKNTTITYISTNFYTCMKCISSIKLLKNHFFVLNLY